MIQSPVARPTLKPGIREADLYGGTRHRIASAYRSTSAQRKSKRQPCTAPTRPCSGISGRICENLRGYTRKPAHPVAQKDDPPNQQDRIHYTLVTAALVAFIWWLDFYNLLGWKF